MYIFLFPTLSPITEINMKISQSSPKLRRKNCNFEPSVIPIQKTCNVAINKLQYNTLNLEYLPSNLSVMGIFKI